MRMYPKNPTPKKRPMRIIRFLNFITSFAVSLNKSNPSFDLDEITENDDKESGINIFDHSATACKNPGVVEADHSRLNPPFKS